MNVMNNILDVLNSTAVSTLLAILLGGLFAQWISHRWQQRAKQWEIKYDLFKEINEMYWDTCNLLTGFVKGDMDKLSDCIGRFPATISKIDVFFDDKSISGIWDGINKALVEFRNKMQDSQKTTESRGVSFDGAYAQIMKKANEVFQKMSNDMGLRYKGF